MTIYVLKEHSNCGMEMTNVTREYLQSLLRPEAWDVTTDAEGSQRYPDGSDWADPTSFPVQLRRLLGPRVEIYGFWGFENPAALKLISVAERHDFSIVDKRWIVDPWSTRVKGLTGSGIVDLKAISDTDAFNSLYGHQACWERSLYLEHYADCQNAQAPSNGPSADAFALDGIDL